MTGRFITTAVFLLAALAVVNSIVVVVVGRRRRALAYMQNLPADCAMTVEVPKRDGSNEIAFHICVQSDNICTSIDVPTCTATSRINCQGFNNPDVQKSFEKHYPDAYAEVCEDGETLCLYTDIVYHTCGAAKVQEERICLPLSNGEEECAEIPDLEEDGLMIQKMSPQAYRRPSARYQLPSYPEPRIQQFIDNNREEQW